MTDGRRVLALAGLLFAFGTLPWLAGHFGVPSDRVFTGILFNVPDHAQYFSWVTASREGLFISNTMTPEPNPPVFMNPMMWLLARIQAGAGLSFVALVHVWRALAVVVLAAGLVLFVRHLLPDAATARTALVMAIAGSGFGWVLVAVKYAAGLEDVPFPHDIYTAEPNTLFASYAYPYLALAQGLVALTLAAAWRAASAPSPRWVALATSGGIGLALSHPYDLLTVYAVVGVMALAAAIEQRRLPWPWIVVGTAIAATSGPIAIYYYRLTAGDPLWQAILAQYPNAGVWTPPHWHLVVLMGLPLLLAIPALRWGRDAGALRLLSIWFLVGLVLMYLPVVFQVKLLTGWQMPVAALAALTWHRQVWPRIAPRLPAGMASPVVAALVVGVLVVPTNLYLAAWRVVDLRRYDLPHFLHRDESAALAWIASRGRAEEVVIAPLALGQFVPNLGRSRAFVAHWAMTNRFFERREAAEHFFAPSTSDAERLAMMDGAGITLALVSRATSAEGLEQLKTSPAFEVVFERDDAVVVQRRPGTAGNEGRP